MAEISLGKSYVHDYQGSDGKALYDMDKKVIERILDLGYRDMGFMELVRDEVGSYCYDRVRIIFEGDVVFSAQETSSGDWYVNWCSIPQDSFIWRYVFS